MDPSKSALFVARRGSETDRARLRWLLEGVRADSTLIDEFAGSQNDDGGFPFPADRGGASTVSDTLNALWKLEELGALGFAVGGRALQFIASVQRSDGGWDEDPAVERQEAAPWRLPGQVPARMYLSASALYWLSFTRRCSSSGIAAACRFLVRHQAESGLLPGFYHSTWIGASALLIVGGEYEENARRALEALSVRPLSHWADSQMAWALSCFARAGLPSSHSLVAAWTAELSERQRPDGSWVSEDGESHDVDATIGAAKALLHYGLANLRSEAEDGNRP
jgi:squalene cyclase